MTNTIFTSLCLLSVSISLAQCCCGGGGGGGSDTECEESLMVSLDDVINWKGVSFSFAQGCDFSSMDLSSAQVPGKHARIRFQI